MSTSQNNIFQRIRDAQMDVPYVKTPLTTQNKRITNLL